MLEHTTKPLTAAAHRARRIQNLIENADHAFLSHEIVRSSGGQTLVRAPGTTAYSFEVFELIHNGVLVGGDIDYVVFAYHHGPGSPIDWIGRTEDIDYVLEKATIGLGDARLVTTVDTDLVCLELDDFARDNRSMTQDMLADLKSLLRIEGIDSVEGVFADEFTDDVELLPLGRIPSPRVIYGWRALRHLSRLLRGEK